MKKLTRTDIMSLEQYAEKRAAFRAEVMAHKKNRQIHLGPNATLYFEDRLTVRYQIQEMLRIERIFEAAGSALLVFGFQTRPTAVALTLFSIAATFIGHAGEGDGDPMLTYMHQQALLKDIAVAGGLVALAVTGAGRLSLDASFRRYRER